MQAGLFAGTPARRRRTPSVRGALLLVLVCFVVAGLIQPFWHPLQELYAGLLATAGLPVVLWAQPVPITARLEHRGVGITARGDLFPDSPLGPVETASYSFYLPFIAALLLGAGWRWRLVSPAEVILVLTFFVVIHLAGLVMDLLILQTIFAAGEGFVLLHPIEEALLHGLFRIYVLFGMQLWNGLAVALVLARVLFRLEPDRRPFLAPLAAPRGLAFACIVFCLPAVIYLLAAPPLRAATLRTTPTAITERMMQRAGEAAELDLQEAAGWYSRVLSLDPDHAAALAGLGRIRQLAGEACAARDYFSRSLARQPAPAVAEAVGRFLEQAERTCAAQAARD